MKLKDLQFTAGPWHFEPNNQEYDGFDNGFDVFANGINNWLATVKYGDGGINIKRDVAKQNAILISHAPKMLELLKQTEIVLTPVVSDMEIRRNVTGYFWNTEVDAMKQLLTEINNLLNS